MLLSGQNVSSLIDEVFGVTAVTMSRNTVAAITAGTSGTLYAQLIALPGGLTVNNLDFWMVGASTTPSHGWMVLMTADFPGGGGAGTVLAATADNTGGQAANTYYRRPVVDPPSTGPFVTPPGSPSLYYIGVMLAAGTVGTVAGGAASPNINAGFPLGTRPRFITAGTGFTTPPASGTAMTYSATTGASANMYAAAA